MIAKLIPPSGGGAPPAYTLVSSTNRNYPAAEIIENCSLWSNQGDTGEVRILLGRNKTNLWSVQIGMSEPTSSALNFDWTRVGFQQPQDWPAWTPAQQKAYEDLTSSKNTYPSVRQALGCNPCQPIRSYYDGGIGGNGQAPTVTRVNYAGLTYQVNPDYTEQDFNAVRQQLSVEQGYLSNVYVLYSLFLPLTRDPSGYNIPQQLGIAAGQIEQSLRDAYADDALLIERLELAADVSDVASQIPYVGTAFSAASGVLRGAAYLTPSYSGVPDSYALKLKELVNQNTTLGADLARSIDTWFTGFTNDRGKLQTIGSGYDSQKAPWYMCVTCRDSNVPRSAIPMLALGAKRGFYAQLLPYVYSLNAFYATQAATPTRLGGWVGVSGAGLLCYPPYEDSPSESWIIYTNITTPSTRDFYIMTQIKTDTRYYPFYGKVLRFPSLSLLDDLFSTPVLNSNGTLARGAGFIRDRFVSAQGRSPIMPVIPGYVPNNAPCQK